MDFINRLASLFFLFLLFSFEAYSKALDVNLAAFSSSKSIYRGALIWDDPDFFIGPSFVFYKKLSLRGPSLVYTNFKRKSPYVLNYSFSFFNDRKPFITTSSRDEDFRNSRSSSMNLEMHGGYKFGFMKLFEVGLKLSYEFKEYDAWYMIPYFQMPVAPFVKFNFEIGIGEKDSNRYLYGDGAVSGVGYTSLGLSAFVPLSVGRLIFSLDRVSVEQSENRGSSLVGGKPENLNFSIRYFVKIY